jgi:phosphopantetheine adenylyltransferase
MLMAKNRKEILLERKTTKVDRASVSSWTQVAKATVRSMMLVAKTAVRSMTLVAKTAVRWKTTQKMKFLRHEVATIFLCAAMESALPYSSSQ